MAFTAQTVGTSRVKLSIKRTYMLVVGGREEPLIKEDWVFTAIAIVYIIGLSVCVAVALNATGGGW